MKSYSRVPLRAVAALIVTLSTLGVPPASAQASHAPRLTITVANLSAAARHARRSTTKPGDLLHFTLTFLNPSARPLRNAVLQHPVPPGTHLVDGRMRASRPDARLEFSADTGRSWSARPTELVTLNGMRVRGFISPDRYTNLRWTVPGPIMPRAIAAAEFDVIVVRAVR